MEEYASKDKKIINSCQKLALKMVEIKGDMSAVRSEKITEMEKMNEFFPNLKDMLTKAFGFHQSMIDDLMEKYKRELTLRRKYFNELQDLRGNIRVFCRIRPLLGREKERGYGDCIAFPTEGMIQITDGKSAHTFEFDRIYTPTATQEQVSADTTEYVQSVMDGYNVSIFAYGQTGSGKTYTMNGPPDNPGVNMRALKFLFKLAKQREPMFEYKIRVAMLEVYNEKINDLLRDVDESLLFSASKKKGKKKEKKKPKSSKKEKVDHKIRHLPDGTVEVTNLKWVPVSNEKNIVDLQNAADKTRSMAATDMNLHSSRSHMIVVIQDQSRFTKIV